MGSITRPLRVIFHKTKLSLPKDAPPTVIRVQRVRIKNVARRKRILLWTFNLYLIHYITTYTVNMLEDAEKNGPIVDEEPVNLFFPLPLTTKVHPPEPYTGNSPEWREFVRISTDRELQNKIRDMLAGIVLSAASNNVPLMSRCGKDLKLRRVWIDLDYPYKAPPEFERSGILITDDTVEIATRPIAASHAKLLERIFWPQPMALSFWEFGKTLVRQTASDVARYFGIDVPGSSGNYVNGPTPSGPATLPASQNAQVQKALEQLRQQATKRPEEVKNPGAMTAETSPSNTASKATEAGKVSGERFTGENKIRSFTDSPWEAFKKKYNQVWKPTRELPPRGCVAVSGLIELESSKAYVVIDVFGWYNPKTRKYDARSLWMSLRKMQYKKQAPLA